MWWNHELISEAPSFLSQFIYSSSLPKILFAVAMREFGLCMCVEGVGGE